MTQAISPARAFPVRRAGNGAPGRNLRRTSAKLSASIATNGRRNSFRFPWSSNDDADFQFLTPKLMKHLVLLILGLLPLTLPLGLNLRAQDLEAVSSGASNDLQKALAELTAARKEVEEERLPLARKLSELEQKLIDRKAEYGKADRLQGNQAVELTALKKQAKDRADEVKVLEALVTEYARSFRTKLSFIEEPRYTVIFDAVDKAAVAPDLTPAQRFAQRSVFMTTSLKRAEAALGGELFEGRALDRQGRVQQGKVALIGPVAVFSDTSGQTAGLLQQELNKTDPTVAETDKEIVAASRTLVTTGQGQVSVDPTLGNAFKLSAMKESLYE